MNDNDELDALYEKVNSLYEKYSNDEITEEEYMEAYNHYTMKKDEQEKHERAQEEKKEMEQKANLQPDRVRSTSIAGLRKKLMEEMKK